MKRTSDIKTKMSLHEIRTLFKTHCHAFATYFAQVRRCERQTLARHVGPFVERDLLYWPHEMLVDVAKELRCDLVAKLSRFGYRLHDKTLRFSLFPCSPYKSIHMDGFLDVETLHPDVVTHLYVTYILSRKSTK